MDKKKIIVETFSGDSFYLLGEPIQSGLTGDVYYSGGKIYRVYPVSGIVEENEKQIGVVGGAAPVTVQAPTDLPHLPIVKKNTTEIEKNTPPTVELSKKKDKVETSPSLPITTH